VSFYRQSVDQFYTHSVDHLYTQSVDQFYTHSVDPSLHTVWTIFTHRLWTIFTHTVWTIFTDDDLMCVTVTVVKLVTTYNCMNTFINTFINMQFEIHPSLVLVIIQCLCELGNFVDLSSK